MKAVHFGAGNIGRGFIGSVLSENGYEICFVDVDQELIDQLNKEKSYLVEIIGQESVFIEVKKVSALNSLTQEKEIIQKIVDADRLTTSVGVGNLSRIAGVLAKGLLARVNAKKTSIDLIANENAINATNLLKLEIEKVTSAEEMQQLEASVGFVNSAIDRQALSTEYQGHQIPLVEPYFEWVINNSESKQLELPKIIGATYVQNLTPYIERKLYLVNAEHAVSAYLGQFLGKATVQEALADEQIYHFVSCLMWENAEYLIQTYGMAKTELEAFINKTLERHSNPKVHDAVERVGRAPLRKLGQTERLVGPLKKLHALNLPTNYGERAIAVVLQYNNPRDQEAAELENMIEAFGINKTLKKYSQLTDEKLVERIENRAKKIARNKQSIFMEE